MPNANKAPALDSEQAREIISYAWGYFDFHAKQRTQMFNFFIISAGVLASAVGLLLRTDAHKELAIVPLYAGTIMSLAFLALDVRNTQLLQMSEDTLDALERWFLFKDLPTFENRDGHKVTLGLISRENDWEGQLRRKRKTLYWPSRFVHYISYNRVKHKMAIRIAESTAFFLFLVSGTYSLFNGLTLAWPNEYRYGLPAIFVLILVIVWFFIITARGMLDESEADLDK